MPSQSEIQHEITARIIDGLRNGVVPWKRTWRNDPNCGSPANALTRRPYSGINPILLDLVGMSRGYSSRWWATYEQWKTLGANVRKRPDDVKPGQWGTNIVFYRQVERTKLENGERRRNDFRSFDISRSSTPTKSMASFLKSFGPANDPIHRLCTLTTNRLKRQSTPPVPISDSAATEPSTSDQLVLRFRTIPTGTTSACPAKINSNRRTSSTPLLCMKWCIGRKSDVLGPAAMQWAN